MKVDDSYESVGGMGFVIKAVDKTTVTVAVDRVYRGKNDELVMKTNERVLAIEDFERFAAPYSKV